MLQIYLKFLRKSNLLEANDFIENNVSDDFSFI